MALTWVQIHFLRRRARHGQPITVDKAQPNQDGRDRDGGGDRDRDRDRDRHRDECDRRHARDYVRDRVRGSKGRDSGGGGRGFGGDCLECGKPGHFAREGSRGGGGPRYGGRDDRCGGRCGGGTRNGHDRNGDRYGGGRSRDSGSRGGSGSDKYSRDHSGPYERPSGGFRS